MRSMPERVRNDGNWIGGNPNQRGECAMLLAYHPVDAAPLPDFPGWDTPHYGFALNEGRREPLVLCMTYHPTRTPQLTQGRLF